jgi:hypothetical protein
MDDILGVYFTNIKIILEWSLFPPEASFLKLRLRKKFSDFFLIDN